MTKHIIKSLTWEEAEARRDALIDLLVDAVAGGNSVNFVWPMTRMKAEAWWESAFSSLGRGERLIFTAEAQDRLNGTVQLILVPQENQAFRAELVKLLVHSCARRQGLGTALMHAAEKEAHRIGRTLLTLDTETGSLAERLYIQLGWTKYGEVPEYATRADNCSRSAVSFFFKAL
jgi:GNAT superfamily N-acetyltransferase